jgi:hypothetical protein
MECIQNISGKIYSMIENFYYLLLWSIKDISGFHYKYINSFICNCHLSRITICVTNTYILIYSELKCIYIYLWLECLQLIFAFINEDYFVVSIHINL